MNTFLDASSHLYKRDCLSVGPQGGAIRSFYLSSVLRSDMGEKRKKLSSFVLAKKLKTTSFVSFRFMLSIHLVIQHIKAKEI